MARIAIIGHTGVVGSTLHRYALQEGLNVVSASRSSDADVVFDLAGPDMSLDALGSVDAVFLCAALTNVDFCEQNPEASRASNVDGPRRVAEWCARNSARLFFFSTDYVFDGMAGPYDETAATNPLNVYGSHKLEAEHVIAEVLPAGHAIVRTTVVFGREQARKNFAVRLVDELRAGRTVTVPDDQIGTPTWSADLAGATLSLYHAGFRGLVHAAGASSVSRYAFALRVAEKLGLDTRLIRASDTASLRQPARRPLQAGLISNRLLPLIGRRMLAMDDALSSFAEDL